MHLPHQRYGSVQFFAAQWAKAVGLPWEMGIERLTHMYLTALQVAHTCFNTRRGEVAHPPVHDFVRYIRHAPPPPDAYAPVPTSHPSYLGDVPVNQLDEHTRKLLIASLGPLPQGLRSGGGGDLYDSEREFGKWLRETAAQQQREGRCADLERQAEAFGERRSDEPTKPSGD